MLVEPNPFNFNALAKCWSDLKNKEIFQVGISLKNNLHKQLPFYFTEFDAPHYQVAPFNPEHVLKHYKNLKNSDLKSLVVESIDLKTFILSVTLGGPVILLSLDIEGIDAGVILDTDFSSMNVSLISFEHLHLGNKSKMVAKHLSKCGFKYAGVGVDHNGYDHLYRKVSK